MEKAYKRHIRTKTIIFDKSSKRRENMNTLWEINLEILELFFKIIEEIEREYKRELNRNERELVFLKLMKEKNVKSLGHTELNQKELIKELVSKNKKILNIDSEGCKIIQKKEKNND